MSTQSHKGIAVLALVAAAACADLPSEPVAGAADARRTVAAPDARGAGASRTYLCVTHVATAGGRWRTATRRVRFPASELAPGGRTVPYRYRGFTPERQVVAGVDCQVPATLAAVQRMNRLLKADAWYPSAPPARPAAPSPSRSPWGSPRFDGTLKVVPLEGITATAQWCGQGMIGQYPHCYPIASGTAEGSREESGFEEWSWGGGDEGDWDADDGTGRPACERDAQGNCKTRPVKSDEWLRLLQKIEEIKDEPDYCRGAKQALRGMAAAGQESQRLRFWDGYDKRINPNSGRWEQRYGENLSDAQGRYIEFDSYWIWHDRYLLVHEGLHAWLAANASGTGLVQDNDPWIYSVQANCV